MHVLTHVPEPGGPGGGGERVGGRGGGGGAKHVPDRRGPQSAQSVHRAQIAYPEPSPPSSQAPSEAQTHVFMQMPEPGGPGGGGLGGDGGRNRPPGGLGGGGGLGRGGLAAFWHEPARRGPQSKQSVHGVQIAYPEPAPPSSQSPSRA